MARRPMMPPVVDRLIWRQELQQALGMSLDTMTRYMRQLGKLPQPVNLNPKRVGWKLSTLRAAGVDLP